jgi:hypothetical protein
MDKLVTTVALAAILLGATLFIFAEQIAPAASDAGMATATAIEQAF